MGRPKKNKTIICRHRNDHLIVKALKTEGAVTVDGMGDFVVREMKQRYYFNPKTGTQKRKKKDIKIVFIANPEFKKLCSKKT